MARDFNGTTDNLAVAFAAISEPFALVAWGQTSDTDRPQSILSVGDADGPDYHVLRFQTNADPEDIRAQSWDGAAAAYAVYQAAVPLNTWIHVSGLFVASNDRRILVGGGNKNTGIGDVTVAGADRAAIGMTADSTPVHYLAGQAAEAAIWDLSVWPGATDSDKADAFERILPSLAAGYSPLFFPLGLIAYWPLVRGLNDRVGGYNLTATGTVVSAHPRIIYPSKIWTPSGVVAGESFVRTINDSVGLTDAESLVKEIYRTFDESMGVTDVKAKVSDSIRIVAESLGITDTFSKEETKVISESLGITDAVSRTSVILRTLAESLGITDSVSEVWVAIRILAESLGITDTVTKDFGNLQIIDDSMGLTDSVSKIHVTLRTLSESLGLADDVARVFVVSRIISDTEGITDGLVLQRVMTVADTLGITDDVTRLIDYLRIEDDDVGLLDSMVRVSLTLRTINDDMEITDEVSAQLGALLKAVWAFVVMRQTHS